MAATYLGALTLAQLMPGVASALEGLGAVAQGTRSSLDIALPALEASVLADVSAQLDATLAIGADLALLTNDPSAAIAGILVGVAQVQANLAALVPSIEIAGQLSANAAVAAELTARKAALSAILAPLAALVAQLSAAVSASLSVRASLSAPGLHAIRFDGQGGALGAEVQERINNAAGLGGAIPVRALLVVADAGNAQATAGLSLLGGA